jgi:hypothetical protein
MFSFLDYTITISCRTFMTMVNDGQIAIKASKWPSFMYDEDEYDEERAERGLCKGYFLVRVSTFGSKLL